ncbi:MAG: protease modulator HflC [Phycisphaerae bacterium]|nr:protease modulator HflC [Phycisphaerae bacterium]
MTPRQRRRTALAVILLVVVVLLGRGVFYVVDQRELAVVLQFGKPVAERTEPGLYLKVPWIQHVRKLPSTRQFWGGGVSHVLPDLPTKDGKKVDVTPWAVWRIKEPKAFVQRLREIENADRRVGEFVRGAVRDVITQYDLTELVRSTDRTLTYSFTPERMLTKVAPDQVQDRPREAKAKIAVGRAKILQQIKDDAMHRLASDTGEGDKGGSSGRGIELIDVGISQIDFVPTVREAAFDRLIAFMDSIAALYENEGQREKQEILNRTKAEVQKIEGEGKQQSNEIRGRVDAEIITMYAKAITEAGPFYTFVRTLDVYREALGRDTQLILTTDTDFLRYFKELGKAPPAAPASRPAK